MVHLLIPLIQIVGIAHAISPAAADRARVDWERTAVAKDRDLKENPLSYLNLNGVAYLKRGERIFLDTGIRHDEARWLKTVPKTASWISLESRVDDALIRDVSGRETTLRSGERWNSPNGLIVRVSSGDPLWAYLHDPRNPKLVKFHGLSRFPFNPDAILPAQYQPANHLDRFRFETTQGQSRPSFRVGSLALTVDGKVYELDAFAWSNGSHIDRLFVPFKDKTNGHESYGGGRYVDVPLPQEMRSQEVLIDFNEAYNPLCSRTPYLDCVIYPGNKLPISIRAGEKAPPRH